MINDKVMIFAPYNYNINAGGPEGFISHNLVNKEKNNYVLSQDFIDNNIFFKIKKRLVFKLGYGNYLRWYFREVGAKKYKFLYFHEALMYEHCKDLISPKQVVILQSHAPERFYLEVQSTRPNNIEEIEFAKRAEENAFSRADIIIFPNKGCLPIYDDLIKGDDRLEFILSGAQKKYGSPLDTSDIIDNGKINLLYIGRRNHIKGFDIVLKAFENALQYRNDINLFVVGNGDKVFKKNVIDVGFSDNPIGWYNSVDYLINANRQSYFDLSIIEALSTGVPIIMSHNYGHEFYKNKSNIITTYDINSNDALLEILIENIYKRDRASEVYNENIRLYDNELSDILCHQRFENFFNTII